MQTGGGPGGLAAAHALLAVGLRPLVMERSPRLRDDAGGGLNLFPNALVPARSPALLKFTRRKAGPAM